MSDLPNYLLRNVSFLTLGLAVSAIAPLVSSVPASTQTTFPDVEPNYWAQPFIQDLAEQNIITGYPDGTYRPDQAVDRDEFAAIIRKAFNKNKVRQIPSASVFKDVPARYWAAPAIEEAYEAGFMRAYPGGFFRPQEEVSRVDAIVSLVNTLNLLPARPQASTQATTEQEPAQAATEPTQATTRQAIKKPIFFPLAFTSMMQQAGMAAPKSLDKPASGSEATEPSGQSVSFNRPPSLIVSNYYTDADQIPKYAVDEVAAATKANIVVNYPNVKVLNPNEPLSRAAAAAFIHQTLVHQGKLKAIPINVEASNYIAGRSTR